MKTKLINKIIDLYDLNEKGAEIFANYIMEAMDEEILNLMVSDEKKDIGYKDITLKDIEDLYKIPYFEQLLRLGLARCSNKIYESMVNLKQMKKELKSRSVKKQ